MFHIYSSKLPQKEETKHYLDHAALNKH